MMNIFSKFKVALLGTILSFGLVASIEVKGIAEASAAGETETTTVTDVITADKLPATSNRYAPFTNLSFNSDARYSGSTRKQSKASTYIQFNTSYGIISSVSGGILKSLSVNYPVNANLKMNIFASSEAYSGLMIFIKKVRFHLFKLI